MRDDFTFDDVFGIEPQAKVDPLPPPIRPYDPDWDTVDPEPQAPDPDWDTVEPEAPEALPASVVKPGRPLPVLDSDTGHIATASGFATSRRERKSARRQGQTVESHARKSLMARRKAEMDALRTEQSQAHYLPKSGEARPRAARTYRPAKVTPHRATTEVLGGAYPFLAEEGLGSEGALVGQDSYSGTAFCFDPWELYKQGQLTNPNIFLAGQIGRGKSALAKSLATRFIAFGRRVYVPGDPKGEWTPVARAVGGQAIGLGIGSAARLNPLDEGPRPRTTTDAEWQAQVTASRQALIAALAASTLGRDLAATERTGLDAALATAVRANSIPTLPHVVGALHRPSNAVAGATVEQLVADGRDVAHALGRLVTGDLAGLFDGPSTIRFDSSLPMLSLDLSAISGSDTLLGLVMTCTAAWLESALRDPDGGKRLVVYDEAWRLMAQPALLARMQSQWKLSRAWGLANLMVVHRLSDLEAVGAEGSESRGLAHGLLGDTATRILYNEPSDEAQIAGRVLGLSSTEVAELPQLARGEGLWRVNERAFIVRHLVTPGELEMFSTDARMTGRGDSPLSISDVKERR